MTTIDPRFIPLSTIQEQFWDKLTDSVGPMASGILSFYSDNERSTAKMVYKLTGTPPDYTFVEFGTTITLSSIGTLDDGAGNNFVPYLFPYEGTPDDTTGEIELYYIVVKNSQDQLQFSVSGIPYVGSALTPTIESSHNIIPNGQFLMHRDLPNNGLLTDTLTNVAYGGWQLGRQTTSSTDYVTFPEFTDPIALPTGNPKFACRCACTNVHSGDTTYSKFLQVVFNDVNRFADENTDPQVYSLFFSAKTNDTTTVTLPIKIYKYFGSGGSTPVYVAIDDVQITSSYQSFSYTCSFGSNAGKTIGSDSYVSIKIILPSVSTFDISFTDFCLITGEVEIESFPITTDGQMVRDTFGASLAIPEPDGSNIGLPLILTKDGFTYDDTQVGKIEACVYPVAGNNEVLCDGENYDTSTINSIGIPYSRIADKTFNTDYNLPTFGTGANFFTTFISSTTDHMIITTNKANASTVTAFSNGSISPGFTFTKIYDGNSSILLYGYIEGSNTLLFYNSVAGTPTVPSAQTSGFTNFGQDLIGVGPYANSYFSAGSLPAAGSYFFISDTSQDYYVWFTIDGSGSDPVIGGRIGIEIDLLSTQDIVDLRQILVCALSGYTLYDIQTVAASTITPGSYFKLYNYNDVLSYVWYEVGGSGTDPSPAGAQKGVKVTLTGTETAIQVATATQIAINKAMWAAPDFRGMFLRSMIGNSPIEGDIDPDVVSRYAYNVIMSGNHIGSFRGTQNLYHAHSITTPSATYSASSGGDTNILRGFLSSSTGTSGGNQSNPVNAYVNYVIKI